MKLVIIVIFCLIFISCQNERNKCKTQYDIYEKITNNRELLKTLDCEGKILKTYEVLRISKDSVVFDGAHKEFFDDGSLYKLGFFKMNIQDRVTMVYRKNGSKEVENYYIDGNPKGFQTEYYENGNYKSRCYYVKDAIKILSVFYKINGQVEKIEGKAINVFYDREPDDLKIGDNIFIFNEVPIMEELISVLDIKLVNEKGEKKVDATTQSFQYMDNAYFKGVKFTPFAKGIYKYSAVVSLINKANQSIVKKDTLSFPIIVE